MLGGRCEILLGDTRLPIFVRVKLRDVFTEDLVRRIPFNPLCSGIPRPDAAVGIERKDSVLIDGIDE